jgi:CRP/FNR family transcriptional regulator, cyclic AMP receptor protein
MSKIKKISLFSGLAASEIQRLEACTQHKTYNRGEWVLHKGNTGSQLLFLARGKLQVVDLSSDGREVGLNFLTEGDYFGELSVIDGLPRLASIKAILRSEIVTLPRHEALKLFLHHPPATEQILVKMATSIRRAAEYRSILSINNAYQRVYALIWKMCTVSPGGLTQVEQIPTQLEMAKMVNTSRETVSRAIQYLVSHNIVEKDLRRLIIRNPTAMHQAALKPAQKNEK